MAKRYFEYSTIPSGQFKPHASMGSHHCVVIPQDDTKVVVGSVGGKVVLKPGDTLGYDCGTVWIVPRPEAYKDPIRRVLAQARVPQRLLKYSNGPVEYTRSWEDTSGWPVNSSADPSTGEEATIFGSYSGEDLPSEGREQRRRIIDGHAIVIRTAVGRETTTHRPRRVVSVVVRPHADKNTVTEWLFEEVVPEGITRRREREGQRRFHESLRMLLSSQGLEVSNEELVTIGEMYLVVANARYSRKEAVFQGVTYRLSWYGGYPNGIDQFFWLPSDACGWGHERERAKINFVSALRSGLLGFWVEATKA